jgi:hypothetical protein
MKILNGADRLSSQRIEAMPWAMKYSCSPQKARKHSSCAGLMPSTAIGAPIRALPVMMLSRE